MNELAGGAQELAGGAEQLASGAPALADGAKELAGGLDEAAAEVPRYTATQREKLIEATLQPVDSDPRESKLFHDNGVPLFTSIALWAGGLAAFMALLPLWRRTREAALSVGAITRRSALTGVVLGVLQGAIAGLALPLALGYDAAQFGAFFGVALLAAIAFALVNQGLVALAGGLGKFLSLLVLVAGFVTGVVSTVPGPLQAFAEVTPIGTAFDAFQTIATETSGLGTAVFVLVCWALLGIVLIALAVRRVRSSAAVLR